MEKKAGELRSSRKKWCIWINFQRISCTLTTQTVIPHNLSPVLGATNPLEEATEPYGSGDSSGLHFRHKDKCLTLLPVIVIKCSIMVSFLWRQMWITTHLTQKMRALLNSQRMQLEEQNKTQNKVVCHPSRHTHRAWDASDKYVLQTITSRAVRQHVISP